MSTNISSLTQNNNQTSNVLEINNSNETLITKKYWCYICKKEFSHIYDEKIDTKCIFCGKTFCEIIENDDTSNQLHPMNYSPFILSNNNNVDNNSSNIREDNNNNNINNNERARGNNIRRNIFEITNGRRRNRANRLFDFIAIFQNHNDNIDNIITQLMLNDTNKYGNPPASKDVVEKLKKYTINEEKKKEFGFENCCAVCKDEFDIGEECIYMPCNHYFHGNCLIPWLKERNSCPICRYELPTDDADFEEMKKQKLNNANRNNNNNNNTNNHSNS